MKVVRKANPQTNVTPSSDGWISGDSGSGEQATLLVITI